MPVRKVKGGYHGVTAVKSIRKRKMPKNRVGRHMLMDTKERRKKIN